MRNNNDLYVGDLYQDTDHAGKPIERYYVEMADIGHRAFVDRKQLNDLGVPIGLIIPSLMGWMGCVYTNPTTGDSYFIAE